MDKQKSYTWYKIADAMSELVFSSNGLGEIEVNGKKLCIGTYKEILFACSSKCPHAGGIMSGGYIDAVGNIVCPLHRYKFSLQNGRNSSGEGYFLKTYPVESRSDGIFIGMEAGGFFNWIK